MPLEPHERQLLNNLLQRSHSTRSQDRGSEHSHSSTSTHHDTQPLPLPRPCSSRRLTSNSLMVHDTANVPHPQDLSRYSQIFNRSRCLFVIFHKAAFSLARIINLSPCHRHAVGVRGA